MTTKTERGGGDRVGRMRLRKRAMVEKGRMVVVVLVILREELSDV